MNTTQAKNRLEYLRGEIQAERISYGEIVELQELAKYIDEGDVELLQWAGNELVCELCQQDVALDNDTVCSRCLLNEEE